MQPENGARTPHNGFKHRAKKWGKLEENLSAFMILTDKKAHYFKAMDLKPETGLGTTSLKHLYDLYILSGH